VSQGKSIIALQDLFMLEKNTKGTRGHSLKLTKVRCTREGLLETFFFPIEWLIDGTSWICRSLELGLPASAPLKMVWTS